jgi:hypothetical protein
VTGLASLIVPRQGRDEGRKKMTATMKKLTAAIEGEYLVIKVPLNPTPVRSATGKTLVVASSHGNKETEIEIQGKPVIVGVNAYIHHGG